MSRSIVHKFRIGGMHDSVAVTAVRNSLSLIPGVGAISVNLRKMQVEVVAAQPIEAGTLRKALAGTECSMYELTTNVILAPPEVRDDRE